jgi:hypothetical protein
MQGRQSKTPTNHGLGGASYGFAKVPHAGRGSLVLALPHSKVKANWLCTLDYGPQRLNRPRPSCSLRQGTFSHVDHVPAHPAPLAAALGCKQNAWCWRAANDGRGEPAAGGDDHCSCSRLSPMYRGLCARQVRHGGETAAWLACAAAARAGQWSNAGGRVFEEGSACA